MHWGVSKTIVTMFLLRRCCAVRRLLVHWEPQDMVQEAPARQRFPFRPLLAQRRRRRAVTEPRRSNPYSGVPRGTAGARIGPGGLR